MEKDDEKRDKEHEAAIKAAIPGLLINEIAAGLGGIDQNRKRKPSVKPETYTDKKSFFDQSHPDGTLSAEP